MASDPRATITKLLTAWSQLEADYTLKRDAILAELHAVVGGDDGIGVKLARIKAYWCEAWELRHKEKCDFDHRKDTKFLKDKLAGYSEAEICAKISSYIANDEAYYVRARHSFSLFRVNFNTWRGIPSHVAPADTSIGALKELRGGE